MPDRSSSGGLSFSKREANLADVLAPSPPPQLEERYYLKHFEELLSFVRKQTPDLITPEAEDFVRAFEALSAEARCLFVRMANRKGEVFHTRSLHYDELGDPGRLLIELADQGLVRPVENDHFRAALRVFTKPELVEMALQVPVPGMRASLRKEELVSQIANSQTAASFFPPDVCDRLVGQDRVEPLNYLFFLYYGRRRSGLTSLALRDLGLLESQGERAELRSKFASREAALATFRLLGIEEGLAERSRDDLITLAEASAGWACPADPESRVVHHRVWARLGRQLERAGEATAALRVYQCSDRHPAPERAARLLYAEGRIDECRELLNGLIANPSCDDELLFAEDFYARKFEQRKLSLLTTMLRGARPYPVDETNRNRPEAGVVGVLAREGERAVHAENFVWQQLFGLLFWDLLQGDRAAPRHSEFDWRPAGLDSGVFYEENEGAIEEQLALLDDSRAASVIAGRWSFHQGEPNAFVAWREETLPWVLRLIEDSPPGGLARILRPMTQNHRRHRSGFPDLMVSGPAGLRFIEVKSEGDSLSRQQLTRLEQMARAGFKVEIGAVTWNVDPDQEYVVVDLETTGGSSRWNRITEIGAVRVCGGKIRETWTSLINPERKIAKAVVKLTGITDEMVADAPKFAEVADQFRAFVGDAVFVAHRVKFDYGFLRAEYQRLGQDFRCATFCTVVASRRIFPGLKSYGLANLTREFGIKLESHHRALCDAQATAGILQRINEERKRRSLGS